MELVVKGRKNKIKKSEWGKNKERDKLGSEIKTKSRFEKNQLWKKKKTTSMPREPAALTTSPSQVSV